MGQLRSSPRKLKVADSELTEASRPKTSFTTTTSSPLNKDSIVKSHTGKTSGCMNASSNTRNTMNAKKRLVVPPQGLRPQTSPEVVLGKNGVATNRTPSRLRKPNSKYKAGNASQTNSKFLTATVPEEKPKVVIEEDNKLQRTAEVLVVTGPLRAGTDDILSEVSALGQEDGELENIGRSSSANKQSKEPSPPSRNNRYGNGIKTRLAKLFNKGNACMEEPKVIEPQRNQDVNNFPHNLLLATSGNQRPTRYLYKYWMLLINVAQIGKFGFLNPVVCH